LIIAVDGPAGSGKSTVARLVAAELGFHYLDTGALYRALTVAALDEGLDAADSTSLASLAARCEIRFGFDAGNPLPTRVFIGGRDVTDAIRTPRVDAQVSEISAHGQVREALLCQQRQLTQGDDYVVEGRDIGTVIFPDAEVKAFVTASAEERARRRSSQNLERALTADYDTILAAIRERDTYDSTRAVAPLRPADDAVVLDTTTLNIAEVVAALLALVSSWREKVTAS
jgi:cytidylate kinase